MATGYVLPITMPFMEETGTMASSPGLIRLYVVGRIASLPNEGLYLLEGRLAPSHIEDVKASILVHPNGRFFDIYWRDGHASRESLLSPENFYARRERSDFRDSDGEPLQWNLLDEFFHRYLLEPK